jgi:hypothetical protein
VLIDSRMGGVMVENLTGNAERYNMMVAPRSRHLNEGFEPCTRW